jgi:hypothetical protein
MIMYGMSGREWDRIIGNDSSYNSRVGILYQGNLEKQMSVFIYAATKLQIIYGAKH